MLHNVKSRPKPLLVRQRNGWWDWFTNGGLTVLTEALFVWMTLWPLQAHARGIPSKFSEKLKVMLLVGTFWTNFVQNRVKLLSTLLTILNFLWYSLKPYKHPWFYFTSYNFICSVLNCYWLERYLIIGNLPQWFRYNIGNFEKYDITKFNHPFFLVLCCSSWSVDLVRADYSSFNCMSTFFYASMFISCSSHFE